MSNEHDGLFGSSRHDRHDVPELDLAKVDKVLCPDILLRRQTQRRDGLAVPAGGTLGLLRARNTRGILGRELLVQRRGSYRVEEWREPIAEESLS
jgi:hypothetical protein